LVSLVIFIYDARTQIHQIFSTVSTTPYAKDMVHAGLD